MFTGDLNDLSFDDILSFLAQDLPEGQRLDYKEAFPKNLEKTMAAMANTEGGLILIGVAEDPERPRHPRPQPIGIATNQAEESVVSKGMMAIREPLFPEVTAVPFPDDPSRCVLVVRIQPSERAPHAVGQGLDVFRRVDAQALREDELESRMDLDRIDWLLRRRTESVRLLDSGVERGLEALRRAPQEGCEFRVVVRPALVHSDPLTVRYLINRANQHRAHHGGYYTFPSSPSLRTVGGGVVSDDEPRCDYMDVNGVVIFREWLEPTTYQGIERLF